MRTPVVGLLACFLLCCAGEGADGEAPLHRSSQAMGVDGGGPVPQQVLPIFNQTERDPNDTYVAPSLTDPLPIGARVDVPGDFELYTQTPYIVQRLTERTYWVALNVYAVTVYVGRRGVLVIDAGGHGGPPEVQALLAAVASITPLPIRTLVLSHPHTDHVGNSVLLKQLLPDLEIIGTRWLDEQIEQYGYPIARPTRLVRQRHGRFYFEGKRFRMVTPVAVGHTPADSYVITPDRVLHVVDYIHAGRLTFIESSVVQNMDGFITVLRHLAGESDNYDYINPGHLNVGNQADVNLSLDYYHALYVTWWEALQELPPGQFLDPTQDNVAVYLRNFFDAIAERMFYKVAPEFGHVRFFEVARDHASKVHENQFLHRLNASDPSSFGRIPDFTPISPHPL